MCLPNSEIAELSHSEEVFDPVNDLRDHRHLKMTKKETLVKQTVILPRSVYFSILDVCHPVNHLLDQRPLRRDLVLLFLSWEKDSFES